MQIIVTKINNSRKEIYQANSIDNNQAYTIRNNAKLFGHKYEIFDSKNNLLGKIKKHSSKKYELMDNTKVLDQVTKIQDIPKTKYQLVNSNWTIDVDITFTEYTIYDEVNNKLAFIKYNLPEESWELTTNDDKNLELLLLLLLTVISISKS